MLKDVLLVDVCFIIGVDLSFCDEKINGITINPKTKPSQLMEVNVFRI